MVRNQGKKTKKELVNGNGNLGTWSYDKIETTNT